MTPFVSVSQPLIDLQVRAFSRMLLQFHNSPVLIDVLMAFISELTALQRAIIDVINLRGCADAVGVNLDALGRIVGQDRTLLDYSEMEWMTPDDAALNTDMAPAWVTGAAVGGTALADDMLYRQLIAARIARNFTVFGSVPEIQDVIKTAFGVDVSFEVVNPMEVDLIVSEYAPYWIVNFIIRTLNDPHIEGVYFSPFPATLRIAGVQYIGGGSSSSDSSGATYLVDPDGNYVLDPDGNRIII